MIYTVHFMTTTSDSDKDRPILCAAFLCLHEAERYALAEGADTFIVTKVDNWDAWNDIKKGVLLNS